MRNFRHFILFISIAIGAMSCTKAAIKGGVTGLVEGDSLVLKELKGNERLPVDSVTVDRQGRFDLRFKMERDTRNFFFLYHGKKKLASLILSPGDRVEVACDTSGSWTVTGSDECENLRQNEIALASVSRLSPLTMKDFVAHYRKMLTYVMKNPHSLTIVPVLLQKIRDIPVFGQPTDGVIFAGAADSLEAVYPKSPYVAMLRNASKEKFDVMNLQSMLERANAVAYPQIELSDINGKVRKLSDFENSKTLIVFWNASDVKNKMFNQDVLMPVFEQYEGKGLNIYQVGLLSDKSTWALAVRQQALPWTSVFDGKGSTIKDYRISQLPSVFFLEKGILKKIDNPDKKSVSSALR